MRLHARQFVMFLAALGIWEALSTVGWLDSLFFPPPSFLVRAGWTMAWQGELLPVIQATLAKALLGFAFGSASGAIAGLLMGGSVRVRRNLEPVISALYTTPKLSLLPILLLILGIGRTAGVLLIAVGCFIILALQLADSIRNLNPVYAEMAANYGASRKEVVRNVYLPATLPSLFTGLRLALGRSLVTAISVEMISSGDGLGGMIWMAWQLLATERLFIAVFFAALLGLLFHGALHAVETKAVPWSDRNA